jgi:translation initiation factor IF-2
MSACEAIRNTLRVLNEPIRRFYVGGIKRQDICTISAAI